MLMVIVTDTAAEVPTPLVAVMLTDVVPAAVGVPLITPVAVSSVSQAGRVPLAMA